MSLSRFVQGFRNELLSAFCPGAPQKRDDRTASRIQTNQDIQETLLAVLRSESVTETLRGYAALQGSLERLGLCFCSFRQLQWRIMFSEFCSAT